MKNYKESWIFNARSRNVPYHIYTTRISAHITWAKTQTIIPHIKEAEK